MLLGPVFVRALYLPSRYARPQAHVPPVSVGPSQLCVCCSGCGTMRSLMFYLQTSAVLSSLQPPASAQVGVLVSLQFAWVTALRGRECAFPRGNSAHSVRARRNLQVSGIDCVSGLSDISVRTPVILMMPLVFVGVVGVTYCGGLLLFKYRYPTALRRATWWRDCVRGVLYCCLAVYFPIVGRAVCPRRAWVSPWQCSRVRRWPCCRAHRTSWAAASCAMRRGFRATAPSVRL